jgi:hypothetical protein
LSNVVADLFLSAWSLVVGLGFVLLSVAAAVGLVTPRTLLRAINYGNPPPTTRFAVSFLWIVCGVWVSIVALYFYVLVTVDGFD